MLVIFRLAILSLLFIQVFTSQAEQIETLSLQFEREVVEEGSKEVTHGTIYYDAPEKVIIEVTDPISQIMAFEDRILEIYYPNKKHAFRFKSKAKMPLPFIDTILRITQADYGLTDFGYSILKHEMKDDTVYTYWNPPRKMGKVLGIAILGSLDDRIVSFEMQTPDAHIAAKSLYRNHIKLGDRYIPMEMSSEIRNPEGVVQYEHVTYTNARLNSKLPDRITNFEIPKSVKVKEVKW